MLPLSQSAALPLFPTTVAGSLPKPSWLAEPNKLWAPWRLQGDALAQAKEASLGQGVWPIAVCKDDQEDAVVTISLEDFLDLLREWWSTRGT